MTDTPSVLDQMTAGIMGRKEAAAAKLTPVNHERVANSPADLATGAVAPLGATLPNEERQAILTLATEARDALYRAESALDETTKRLRDARDAVRKVESSINVANGYNLEKDWQEAIDERNADPTFAETFKAQQEAAQAATFGRSTEAPVPQEAEQPPVVEQEGWVCPTHGSASLTTLTSGRTKRVYRSCTACQEFEK